MAAGRDERYGSRRYHRREPRYTYWRTYAHTWSSVRWIEFRRRRRLRSGTNLQNSSTIPVNDGQWRHFAVVREGPTPQLFIDGALDCGSTDTGTTHISNNTDILTGNGPCVGVDGTTFFNGELDEIEYCNTALTANQVQGIFNAGSAGQRKPESETGPVISSVNSAASGRGELSRGIQARVNGRNFSARPEEGCLGGPAPWPTSLSPCNAMVLVNGEPAPMGETFWKPPL